MSYSEKRKLRLLKHDQDRAEHRSLARGLERLEANYVADVADLDINPAGVLSIDLGGAAKVTEIKNETGTCGLLAVLTASGRAVLVQFSEPAVVVEGDNDVEVTFL